MSINQRPKQAVSLKVGCPRVSQNDKQQGAALMLPFFDYSTQGRLKPNAG